MQPNTSRALTFAQSFIASGGAETLLFLLQREAKFGDNNVTENSSLNETSGLETTSMEGGRIDYQVESTELEEINSKKEDSRHDLSITENAQNKAFDLEKASNDDGEIKKQLESPKKTEPIASIEGPGLESKSSFRVDDSTNAALRTNIERLTANSESQPSKSLSGITFSINAVNARNNAYNIDNDDGVVVGIIKLLGALVTSGHLKFGLNSATSTLPTKSVNSGLYEDDDLTSGDKIFLLLFALQKALEAAPSRLMTANVYTALLGATVS